MNKPAILLLLVTSSLTGCTAVSLVPPEDVPVAVPSASSTTAWRPYSSGPLQASSPGITSGSGGAWADRSKQAKGDAVVRSNLPPLQSDRIGTREGSMGAQASADGSQWKPYGASSRPSDPPKGKSVFGSGVTSSWAVSYVPASLRIEFGIFAAKAAADGQARMVTPTGQVYSASVVQRAKSCTTVEIGVTEGGELPIIARGSARVCK